MMDIMVSKQEYNVQCNLHYSVKRIEIQTIMKLYIKNNLYLQGNNIEKYRLNLGRG